MDSRKFARRRTQRRRKAREQCESLATRSAVVSLVSAVLCAGLLSPLAVVQGRAAKRLAIRNDLPTPAAATIGLVLGWLQVFWLFLFFLGAFVSGP